MPHENTLWLGTYESYSSYMAAKNATPPEGWKAEFDAGDNDASSPLLQVHGSVGVVKVAGSLVQGRAGWMRYFGQTGYDDIRHALVVALQNPSVGSILLDVSSNGGHVAGVHELAQVIKRIDKVKPVISYTGSDMKSAALWLGSSARQIFVSPTAEYGSIGILQLHAERSKALEEEGIKVTVIRAGAKKAMATPYEPLSKEAREDMEAKAAELYDVFLGHICDCRNVSISTGDAKFGQGVTFIGKSGVPTGLVDKVGGFEEAYARAETLAKAKLTKKPNARYTNMGGSHTSAISASGSLGDNPASETGVDMPKPLTDEQITAMAAGVILDDEITSNVTNATTAPEVKGEVGGQVPEGAKADEAGAQALAAVQAELVKAQAELASVTNAKAAAEATFASALAQVKAGATATEESMKPFVEIARAAMKSMAIALNEKTDAMATMPASEVLAEHGRLATMFRTKIKAGGVAATPAKETEKKAQADLPLSFLVATNLIK